MGALRDSTFTIVKTLVSISHNIQNFLCKISPRPNWRYFSPLNCFCALIGHIGEWRLRDDSYLHDS